MRRVLVLVAAMLAVLLPACSRSPSPPESTATSSTPAAPVTPGVNATDRAFASALLAQRPSVEQMIALARGNSGNPRLIALADALERSEQQQSDTVNALLVQWTDGQEGGQGPPPPGPTLFDKGAVERLGSLSGPEFDTLWLQAMLNHHQAVMIMASSEIREGEDVNAKTLAQAIISTRQEETGHMQQLLGGG
ncbi:DUF305 domain-containing protein [Mycolicibacterium bacteremicum]|uniref:DUF305 domain-containing protein n=1 Tax=Mycolicibacterium bacteremicum TaxID=564198 RepID=UPI0009F49A46|nr:DUF305 domain-containing protein [Mycolicibacterium bacteremicum]MCV7432614.1 DUF305 domain-containing protein [Mycolicibacterium bacteremicum]